MSTQAVRRVLTPAEHNAAWHAIEGAAGEEGADPGTVLAAVLRALNIDAPGAPPRPDYTKEASTPCPSTPFTIAPAGEVWTLTHNRIGLAGEFVTERGARQHAAAAHQAWRRENPHLANRRPGCWCPTGTCTATPAA